MNEQSEAADPPVSSFDLAPGLIEYYSSQAELMLAQYENINRLLGPSTHGTPSGDLCENLLREFLRRFLPRTLSVDKGYFYGRSLLEGKDTHSPEIDILVHDTHNFLPLARTGEFVIVRPQAVRAMIQVKRTFTGGQVESGLKNVIQAKQQLLDVLWPEQKKAHIGWNDSVVPPRVFTGIVGFEGQLGRDLESYKKSLLRWHVNHRTYDRPQMVPTSMYVLPSFIGSLKKFFLVFERSGSFTNQRYLAYDSEYGMERITTKRARKSRKSRLVKKNVCLQAFLSTMYNVIGGNRSEMPPFAFPPALQFFDSFPVLRFDVTLDSALGRATLHRNDGWTGQYRREDGPVKETFHLHCDENDGVTQTELLRTELTPHELFVNRETPNGAIHERYVRDSMTPAP